MPKCSECGSATEQHHRFCAQCGGDLKLQQMRNQRVRLEADRAKLDSKIHELIGKEEQLRSEPRPRPVQQRKAAAGPLDASGKAFAALAHQQADAAHHVFEGLEEVRVKLPVWALIVVIAIAALFVYSLATVTFAPPTLGANASPAPLTGAFAAVNASANATATPSPSPTPRPVCVSNSSCVMKGGLCCPSGGGPCAPLSADCPTGAIPLYEGCACSEGSCVPAFSCIQPTPTPTAAPSPTPTPEPTPTPTPVPLSAPAIINLQALTTRMYAEISWITDFAANFSLSWGRTYPGSDGNVSSFLHETSHYYKLEPLEQNTTYQYGIVTCRAGGLCSSAVGNFTTRA